MGLAVIAAAGAPWGCRPAPRDYSDVPVVPLESVYPEAARVHVVEPGDTLSAIGRRYGVGLGAILEANPGIDPDVIHVGQEIRIPP